MITSRVLFGGGDHPCRFTFPCGFSVWYHTDLRRFLGRFWRSDESGVRLLSLRAGVASSTLGIAQVCGSSLWIWLAAVVGIGAWNMLIGILIACSIVSLLLIMFVAPDAPLPLMKKSITTLDLNLLLCLQLLMQERSVTKAAKRMNVTLRR